MSDTIEPLILDLLEWIGPKSRPYAETLEAWRTSCPQFPVWEEAHERGYVTEALAAEGDGSVVSVTRRGWEHLREQRPVLQQSPLWAGDYRCVTPSQIHR
jgi:D-3-phosphoglycerate dehydrogenase / 2-oxoglutarate reductase